MQVGNIEGEIVVAAVPQDDVHFLFSLPEDGFVIDTGIDDDAIIDVGFVFFAFLDGAFVLVEVLVGCEALHLLFDQVAVGHRMTDGGHLVAHVAQDQRNPAGGLALAGTGAHGADRHDRLGRFDLGVLRAHQAEIRAGSIHQRGLVHDNLMRHVAVGKDHLVDLQGLDQFDQVALRMDRDALRVLLAGQRSRVFALIDVRDLGGGESNDFVVGIIPEESVEIMEIAPCSAHDQCSDRCHSLIILLVGICFLYITSGVEIPRRFRLFWMVCRAAETSFKRKLRVCSSAWRTGQSL